MEALKLAEKFGFQGVVDGNKATLTFPEGKLVVAETKLGWRSHQGLFEDPELAFQHFSAAFSKQWQAHVFNEVNEKFAGTSGYLSGR